MEQHAVPQDITGFKFKLVGEMTLKQFGELAGGAVIAYLFYATTWPAIIKWPFAIFFGLFGFALAFLPIQERPLDIWIINFFKAIYQPTLFIWKKGAIRQPIPIAAIDVTTMANNPAATSPTPVEPSPQVWPFQPENTEKTTAPVTPVTPLAPAATPTEPATVSIEDLQKLRDDKIKELEEAVSKLEKVTKEKTEDVSKVPTPPQFMTVDDLAKKRDEKKIEDEKTLRELTEQSKNLTQQTEEIKTKMQALQGSDTTSLQTQLQTLEQQKNDLNSQIEIIRKQAETANTNDDGLRVVDKPVARQTVISLTETPNVINGIVANSQGVPLDNTILIIKDKAGNSIRALKTNQIGQFIASTPLENGTYYLEFERQGSQFDVLEIVMNGKVIQPITVHAKN